MLNYNLPKLPDGYRWYIKNLSGSPYLCLQKKSAFFWRTLTDEYVVLWHAGDYASRVRDTADSIMRKEVARQMRLHFGEAK